MTTNINTNNINQNVNVDSYLMKNIPSADITQRPLASNQTQIINKANKYFEDFKERHSTND